MRHYRARVIAAVLALAIGVGVDSYVRRAEEQTRTCWGCRSLSCEIVHIADHPIVFAHVLWNKLTE